MSNTLRNLMSRGGLSFAHLGRGSRASDDNDPPADDDSGKGKKGKRADEDGKDPEDQNRDDGDSKKGKRADNDGQDPDDKNEDGEVDDDGKGSGKKGKRADDGDGEDPEAEDDDDDEEEMRGKSAVAKARRRERARCAAIFACKAAGRNTELAAALAFESTMTRKEAIAVLNKSPAAESGRGRRQNPNLGAGGDRSMSSSDAVAASWDVAFQRAGARRNGQR